MVSLHGGWAYAFASDNLNWIICHTWYNFEQPLWWLAVCFCRCVAGLNIFPQWSHKKINMTSQGLCHQCVKHVCLQNCTLSKLFFTLSTLYKLFHVTNVKIYGNAWKHIRSHVQKSTSSVTLERSTLIWMQASHWLQLTASDWMRKKVMLQTFGWLFTLPCINSCM